jgi:hypothetical protein
MAASRYRIVLRGRLSEHFESAFDGMTLEHEPNRTVLVGDVRDQAQLYGLLDRLQEFGIELLAVEPAEISDGSSEPGASLLSGPRGAGTTRPGPPPRHRTAAWTALK